MIGGGPGSFIGAVHRKAAALDGNFELVCGTFSSDRDRSMQTAKELGLDGRRVYSSYDEMLSVEATLPDDQRIQAVAIVTPNHVHADPAKKSLRQGFHVIIDKPLALTLNEALSIRDTLSETGNVLALTHTYAGYPMVKQAREMVKSGDLGQIRKVYVEYPQGWLSTFLEGEGNRQASWRTDPSQSGAGGSVGDIGTHAAHLAEYVSGLKIVEVCAELNTVVKGRKLDDDVAALLHFDNGASGVLIATQVAAGEENNVKIRVYGEHAGLEWCHVDPNSLLYKPLEGPTQQYRAGTGYLTESVQKNTRLPSGHPEGYIEAFANIYNGFAEAVRDHISGKFKGIDAYDFPSITEGVRGMAFVETMIASSKSKEKWTPFKQPS